MSEDRPACYFFRRCQQQASLEKGGRMRNKRKMRTIPTAPSLISLNSLISHPQQSIVQSACRRNLPCAFGLVPRALAFARLRSGLR